MKANLVIFTAGLAAGAALMALIQSRLAPDGDSGRGGVTVARLTDEKQKLSAQVAELEKKLKSPAPESGLTTAAQAAGEPGAKVITRAVSGIEPQMEEMLRKQGERRANREADKIALRLKLNPDQKEALRKFLLDQNGEQRAVIRAGMTGDPGAVDLDKLAAGKEEFLKSLLTPEQQAEYAKSKEEDRTAKAEEYAQRKVRRLTNDLNLSEEQKDRVFQAYAQRKLAARPGTAQPGEPAVDAIGGAALAIASDAAGGAVEMDLSDLMPGGPGAAADREMLSGILTPEQLAVYDQRRAEERAGGGMIHIEDFTGDVDGAVKGAISIQIAEPQEALRPDSAPAQVK